MIMISSLWVLFPFTSLRPASSCSPIEQIETTTGEIDFSIPNSSITTKTWFKVIGNLDSPHRPLIALHGGPGVNSEYLEILSDITFTSAHSGALVVYDQIGNGRSTHLPHKMGDVSFWQDTLFLSELDNLLVKLGIGEYDLLGHSWGGMLAARHATRAPRGLGHIVLMSTPASIELWVGAQNDLRRRLPKEVQDVLDRAERDGTTDSPEYAKAMDYFNSLHLCMIQPVPEEIEAGFECIAADPTVYLSMYGPLDFDVTGSLKNWTVVPDAHKITVPTLITNGRADQATDSVVAPFLKEIPDVRWVKFQNSSHMAHFEERARFMEVVRRFLR